VAGDLVYAFRVMRLPLLAPDGVAIGKLNDIVLLPTRGAEPPEVIGFSAAVQRRRVFVNANRLAELNSDGARLRSWDLDVNPFKPKAGEIMVGKDIIDTRVGDETVSDIALRQTEGRTTKWIVEKVRLARRRPLGPDLFFLRGAPAACWWARTMVLSISTRRTSPSSGSAVIASYAAFSPPDATHRRNRLYTASHRPNSEGRSRHGMPVRARYRTASTNSRSLKAGGAPAGCLTSANTAPSRSQAASVSRYRIADPPPQHRKTTQGVVG